MPLASVESEIMNLRCSSRIDIRHHGLDMGLNEARGAAACCGSMSGPKIWGRTEMLDYGDILMRASGSQPRHVAASRPHMLRMSAWTPELHLMSTGSNIKTDQSL
jgi:hypothetical protein